MTNFYKTIPVLDAITIRDDFLNNFMPTYFTSVSDRYMMFSRSYLTEGLLQVEEILKNYKFPGIEYFCIFRHFWDQPVHIDGTTKLRHSSLNLPIAGNNTASMRFYDLKENATIEITDANYPKSEDLIFKDELFTDQFALINSGVPHGIANVDSNDPRITLCIRFYGNPPFEYLYKKLP